MREGLHESRLEQSQVLGAATEAKSPSSMGNRLAASSNHALRRQLVHKVRPLDWRFHTLRSGWQRWQDQAGDRNGQAHANPQGR